MLLWFQFNISHKVKTLSFGDPYPGIINPLDGTQVIAESGKYHFLILSLNSGTFPKGTNKNVDQKEIVK